MTHPDILQAERTGYLYEEPPPPKRLGKCELCSRTVYDDNGDAVESNDGVFCCMDCCEDYYGIRRLDE